MDEWTKMEDFETKHKQYAAIVKGVHSHLRKQYKNASGDFEQVWDDHCQNQDILSQYATAMHSLATDIWTRRPETRIHWSRDICLWYFLNGGLEKLHQKEARKLAFELSNKITACDCSNVSETNACKSGSEAVYCPCDALNSLESSDNDNSIHLPFNGKILVLDVGSCYNPFKEFDEFSTVGVDLCPATKSVLRCDFLRLEVTRVDSCTCIHLDDLQNPITSLPGESFHVVMFSLLLEYLPSPCQRWACCFKAHQLLMLDGLLIIITPDSHHQQRNAPMMKSWKLAIEAMGFTRCKYEKQEHLHCMAFRKTHRLTKDAAFAKAVPDMLYIPQDLHYTKCADDRQNTKLDIDSVNESRLDFMDCLNEIALDE